MCAKNVRWSCMASATNQMTGQIILFFCYNPHTIKLSYHVLVFFIKCGFNWAFTQHGYGDIAWQQEKHPSNDTLQIYASHWILFIRNSNGWISSSHQVHHLGSIVLCPCLDCVTFALQFARFQIPTRTPKMVWRPNIISLGGYFSHIFCG